MNLVLSHHGLTYLEDRIVHKNGAGTSDLSGSESTSITETPSFEVAAGDEFYLLCMSSDVETSWATNAVAVEKEEVGMKRH